MVQYENILIEALLPPNNVLRPVCFKKFRETFKLY